MTTTTGMREHFYTLKDGTEIMLSRDDFPEPSASVFSNCPYRPADKEYRQWRASRIGNYYKSCYRAERVARDKAHFLSMVGDARFVMENPNAWKDWLKERSMWGEARRAGRPRKNVNTKQPKVKRSDLMRELLSDAGFVILEDNTIDGFECFTFLSNGKVKFEDDVIDSETTIMSAHAFVQKYN